MYNNARRNTLISAMPIYRSTTSHYISNVYKFVSTVCYYFPKHGNTTVIVTLQQGGLNWGAHG